MLKLIIYTTGFLNVTAGLLIKPFETLILHSSYLQFIKMAFVTS